MPNNKKKTQKRATKKPSKKNANASKPVPARRTGAGANDLSHGDSSRSKLPAQVHPAPHSTPHQEHRGPTIEIRSIDGETTIGDLIVAFPRTRDVLMKHGLRFDVEEAGYLYMTLSVFSAMHGHTTSSLVERLVVASKEPPLQQVVQALRPVPAPTS